MAWERGGGDRSPETGQSLPKVDQQGAEVGLNSCNGLMRAKRSQGSVLGRKKQAGSMGKQALIPLLGLGTWAPAGCAGIWPQRSLTGSKPPTLWITLDSPMHILPQAYLGKTSICENTPLLPRRAYPMSEPSDHSNEASFEWANGHRWDNSTSLSLSFLICK